MFKILPKIKFVYNRRKIENKEGKSSVEIEIYFASKRRWISTGVMLKPSEWSVTRHVVKHPKCDSLNKILDECMSRVNDAVSISMDRNGEFTWSSFNSIIRDGNMSQTFLEWVNDRIHSRSDISVGTFKHQLSWYNILEEYGRIKEFSDLTTANIIQYDEWLHSRGICGTTIFDHHKRMKAYINMAIKFDLIDKNPYDRYSPKRGKPATRNYLTLEEFEAIRDFDFSMNKTLEKVRDCFLFLCYTALSYSDAAKLTRLDYIIQGRKIMIQDSRTKTDEDYYIVLVSQAVKILRKYNFSLPFITNQKMNMYLKIICGSVGLKKQVTTHWGRHTSAMIALNNGIPIDTVARMLGHASSKTTMIYAHMMQDKVEDAYKKMEKVWK